MMERDDDHFDLDDDFVAESDEDQNLRKVHRPDGPSCASQRFRGREEGKAAWSKLEDVLAERRLQKELNDFEEEE